MRKLFGTDGIRGMANRFPMTLDVCEKLTKALMIFKKDYDASPVKTIIIGKDTRVSCDIFEHALAAQFASLGVDVRLIGVCPTPAISILTKILGASFGIMISASHNPYWDNGIKIFKSNGLKLTDAEELLIENIMESCDQLHCFPEIIEDKVGRIFPDTSLLNIYIERIKSMFSTVFPSDIDTHSSRKIVLDSSNGSFSRIAPEILRTFGFEVISINDSPNGTNINKNCGIMHPDVISRATLEHKADVGIAFDGDGDRVLLCDEKGRFLDGDHILAILIESVKSSSDNPDSNPSDCAEVVSTIMANFGFEKHLVSRGISLVRTQVGDRYLSEYMQKNPSVLFGGEPSGHIIIREHALTGDGLCAALKILAYINKSGRKLMELCDIFASYPVVSRNAKIRKGFDKHSLLKDHRITDLMQKYEQQLSNRGKLIIRPSGTESVIRISAEGEDKQELELIISDIFEAIEIAQSHVQI